jgi:hypothetical protein
VTDDLASLALATTPASRARVAIATLLEDAGIAASLDAGAFYPQPIGVIVGLPRLVARTLAARSFVVPVLVVSGDAVNIPIVVDRLYALADDVATATRTASYRPSSWRGSPNAEPLPAVELDVTVTVTETEV